MTPKQNVLKSLSIALAFLCMTFIVHAQTVTISGTQPVDIGCEYQYTAAVSNVPSDWTIVDYKWQATFIGPTGTMRYVSGFSGSTPIYTTTSNSSPVIAKTKDLWAKWDGFFYPGNVQVIFQIRYTTVVTGSTINESISYYTSPSSFAIKGIPANPAFTGSTTVQKCCVSNITYTATNYGDANTFDQWTYPAGWTQVSQIGNSITLTPNAATAGNVTCRVGISTACPPIYKTATIAITRTDPAVTPITANFPIDLLCPNNTYNYSVNAICGATNYNWIFPSGWTIISGQGTPNVSVSTNAAPSSGNITVTASFAGCSAVSYTALLNVLTTSPGPVSTVFAINYHCDGWYLCFGSGAGIANTIPVTATGAQTYTYRVVAPFYFKTNGGTGTNVQSITIVNSYSPPMFCSQANKLTGTLYVKPNNCIGLGVEKAISFSREATCWCDGSQPYPYAGNSNPSLCITPPSGCGPTPLKAAIGNVEEEVPVTLTYQDKIYPNPAIGVINIETKDADTKSIKIISVTGKIVFEMQTSQQLTKVDASNFATGIYVIEVKNKVKIIIREKIMVNKQ